MKWPEDYRIETLRGEVRPNLYQAKKAIARRAAWLQKQIDIEFRPGDRNLQELSAIVVLMEELEARP